MDSLRILAGLQHKTGLFSAAPSKHTGYHRAWIRDTVYASLGLEQSGNVKATVHAIQALLDILHKHRYKILWMIKEPEPKHRYRYIHARYDPLTGEEIQGEWGNKQNDAVGALLFRVGELEEKNITVLRGQSDIDLIQDLVQYLHAIQYWKDPDNGMWEEKEELHASSIGACVAGLQKVASIVDVPDALIEHGKDALAKLLPKESPTRETDLALLSLIWPYKVVDETMARTILHNVETQLVRERGVIRYEGDAYYNTGGEACWTQGLSWLAIIYKNIPHKHRFYLEKAGAALNHKGEMPELYYANTTIHNENTPLGWAQSLYIVAQSANRVETA